jgi:hypothetical protein
MTPRTTRTSPKQLNLEFCQHDGCKTAAATKADRYCAKHLRNFQKYGNPEGLTRIEKFRRTYEEETVVLPSGCRVFRNRYSDSRGYTFITGLDGEQTYAHRLTHRVFNLNGQALPTSTYVLHSCDTPACVDPKHLRSGDAQANSDDRRARNRHTLNSHNKRPRLTPEAVRAIKESLLAGESGYSIAKRFNISQMTVSYIKRGWTHDVDDFNKPKDWKPMPPSPIGRKPKTPQSSSVAA